MAYPIEMLSVGGDFDSLIQEASTALNSAQNEFHFALPPQNIRDSLKIKFQPEYKTETLWASLKDYREAAKGHRPFLIAIVDRKLDSKKWENLFGSHRAENGLAAITLYDYDKYVESPRPFLAYYFIRYALSFVCPGLKSHKETRGCFFDFKERKIDLKISLDSGNFCDECRTALKEAFNIQIQSAVFKMVNEMKSLRANSQAVLSAESRKGHTDIGIITIRDDEYISVLELFAARRRMSSKIREYDYAWVSSSAGQKLTVVVGRSPAQGQVAAQALANNMLQDLHPRWIFVVGIAGGFPGFEYTLGDVLISTRLHDFAVSAAIEGQRPEFENMGSPMTVKAENLITTLSSRAEALGAWNDPTFIRAEKPSEQVPEADNDPKFYGDESWKAKTFKSLKKHFPKNQKPQNPRFFGAPIISGNTLLKDTAIASIWKQTARQAAGVEMELGGVCNAARYTGGDPVHVLGIRGVSDIVGYRRAPEWTEYACRSAAAFSHALIQSGLILKDTV